MREIISYMLYNFNIIYVMFIYVEPAKVSNYLMREYDFFTLCITGYYIQKSLRYGFSVVLVYFACIFVFLFECNII